VDAISPRPPATGRPSTDEPDRGVKYGFQNYNYTMPANASLGRYPFHEREGKPKDLSGSNPYATRATAVQLWTESVVKRRGRT